MKILLEATGLETSHRYRGIGRYVEGLLWGMGQEPSAQIDRLGLDQGALRLRRWRRQADFLFWLESRARLDMELNKLLPSYDIYHSTEPYSVAPLAKRWPCKVVATCHDLIPLLFPQMYPQPTAKVYYKWLKGALRKVDAVIAISQAVKESLVEQFGLPPEQIAVVPHGVEPRFFEEPPADTTNSPTKVPYFFYGGGVDPRKRVELILDALASIQHDIPEHFVLCGQTHGRTKQIQQYIHSLGLGSRVKMLPYVTDAELVGLYRGATGFVFPSLYEGFGLPILEAQAARCPVITTRRSAMPEVAGSAALYLEPADEFTERAALANHMRALSQDAALRARLANEGQENARRFTWQHTAALTLRTYQRAISGEAQS